MTVPPLTEALGIPGAHAVSLLDPDGPRVLWWAGEAPPTEQEAAAAVTLAAAAAGLVLLGPHDDELSDILLTSADSFHVVRLVDDEAPLVAHLTLRRAGANLAMARREFGSMIASYTRQVAPYRATRNPSPALGRAAADGAPGGFASSPEHGAASFGDDSFGNDSFDLGILPRDLGGTRELGGSVTTADAELPRRKHVDPTETDESSDLLSLLGRPYVTDDEVLDRVLVALRQL